MCLTQTYHVAYHDVRPWLTLNPFTTPGKEDYVDPANTTTCDCGRSTPSVPDWAKPKIKGPDKPDYQSRWTSCPHHDCCTVRTSLDRCHWAPADRSEPCLNAYPINHYFPALSEGQPFAPDQATWETPAALFIPPTWYIAGPTRSLTGEPTTPATLQYMARLRAVLFDALHTLYSVKAALRAHHDDALASLQLASRQLDVLKRHQAHQQRQRQPQHDPATASSSSPAAPHVASALARAGVALGAETRAYRAAMAALQTAHAHMRELLAAADRVPRGGAAIGYYYDGGGEERAAAAAAVVVVSGRMLALAAGRTGLDGDFAACFEASQARLDALVGKFICLEDGFAEALARAREAWLAGGPKKARGRKKKAGAECEERLEEGLEEGEWTPAERVEARKARWEKENTDDQCCVAT